MYYLLSDANVITTAYIVVTEILLLTESDVVRNYILS